MKKLSCLVVATAVVMLCTPSAMAVWDGLTAYATWNSGGEAPDSSWETNVYPAWSSLNGFDWLIGSGAGSDAVSGWPKSGNSYPNADGVGKWGGALYDEGDPDADGMCYISFQGGATNEFQSAAGTVEFWFKPDWDPTEDTRPHCLFSINRSGPSQDGIIILYNGDGTATTQLRTWPDFQDLGHDWTSIPLVEDWNHIAVSWDSASIATYANGVMVGETVYSGPDPLKMNFDDAWLGMFLGTLVETVGHQSEGMWDSMAVWNKRLYTGADYTMPTEEIPEPATMGLLALGGLMMLRRRR